jgi:predicted glycosyltransferase involved in capsule biosynthesis
MIYHREFFVAHRTGQAVNSRMESLLRMVGIEDRFLGFSSEISQKLTQIIDYSKVSQRLQERIERSKEFLKKELKK